MNRRDEFTAHTKDIQERIEKLVPGTSFVTPGPGGVSLDYRIENGKVVKNEVKYGNGKIEPGLCFSGQGKLICNREDGILSGIVVLNEADKKVDVKFPLFLLSNLNGDITIQEIVLVSNVLSMSTNEIVLEFYDQNERGKLPRTLSKIPLSSKITLDSRYHFALHVKGDDKSEFVNTIIRVTYNSGKEKEVKVKDFEFSVYRMPPLPEGKSYDPNHVIQYICKQSLDNNADLEKETKGLIDSILNPKNPADKYILKTDMTQLFNTIKDKEANNYYGILGMPCSVKTDCDNIYNTYKSLKRVYESSKNIDSNDKEFQDLSKEAYTRIASAYEVLKTIFSCPDQIKHCHTIITVRDPNYFGTTDISNIKKPTSGSCVFFDGIYGEGIHMTANDESFICDCKDEYTEDSLIVQDLNGKVFRKL